MCLLESPTSAGKQNVYLGKLGHSIFYVTLIKERAALLCDHNRLEAKIEFL